jgi:hypothetical protein
MIEVTPLHQHPTGMHKNLQDPSEVQLVPFISSGSGSYPVVPKFLG